MRLDRTNQLLLATVLVLGTLAGLRAYRAMQPAAELWQVAGFQADAATRLEYTAPEGKLLLSRSDGGWLLLQPRDLPADTQKIETLLRDWAEGFAPDLRLDASPSSEALEAYGLDDAHRAELKIEGAQGTLAWLYLGGKIAGGSNYLQRPGEPEVFRGRVPGAFRLSVDPDAFRDRRLFPFAKDDLAALAITSEAGDFEFARTETDTEAFWTAVRPTGFEPSSRALDSLGRNLSGMKANRILDGADADAARPGAGLDAPGAVVRATTEDGRTWVLSFGADEETDKTVWAALLDDPRLFVVPKSAQKPFAQGASELRDKTVVHFRREDSPKITWSEDERQVEVEPDGERGWKVVAPEGFAPAQQELDLAVNSLLNLQAADLLFEKPPLLPKAAPRIEIATANGTQILTISPQPDAEGRYLAIASGREPVFVLRGAVVERLLRVFRGQGT